MLISGNLREHWTNFNNAPEFAAQNSLQMKSLKQHQSLERICRKYWNEFDPIDVVEFEIDDEYDSYLPQTIRLILECADEHKFYSHIKHCVRVNMGIDDAPHAAIRNFAKKLATLSRAQSDED